MKKRELRERIEALEHEVQRLEMELQAHSMRTAKLAPPWRYGETAYPYPSLPGMTTTTGVGITWIQPHTTDGPIHIYSNGEAS